MGRHLFFFWLEKPLRIMGDIAKCFKRRWISSPIFLCDDTFLCCDDMESDFHFLSLHMHFYKQTCIQAASVVCSIEWIFSALCACGWRCCLGFVWKCCQKTFAPVAYSWCDLFYAIASNFFIPQFFYTKLPSLCSKNAAIQPNVKWNSHYILVNFFKDTWTEAGPIFWEFV